MFDIHFYRFTNPDLEREEDAVLEEHYYTIGWRQRRDPSALFSVRAYLSTYSDVFESGLEPFSHYLKIGIHEGRCAFLSTWAQHNFEKVNCAQLEMCIAHIDSDFVRHQNQKLWRLSDEAVSAWFFMRGWRDHVDPSPHFF